MESDSKRDMQRKGKVGQEAGGAAAACRDGYARLCAEFGERYGFTAEEKETMRLGILYGLEDGEISKYMKVAPETLKIYQACMTGKTRTRSVRELQALFLRYALHRFGLPETSKKAGPESACV